MNDLKLLSKKNIAIVYICFAILILIGTLFDYQIAQFIYNPSSIINKIAHFYGKIPAMFCAFVSGTIFLRLVFVNRKDWKSLLGVIANGIALYFTVPTYTKNFKKLNGLPLFIYVGLICALVLFTVIYVFRKLDVSKPEKARKIGFIIWITAFVQLILISYAFKNYWGRPRFLYTLNVEELEFQPWYQFGFSEAAKKLLANGCDADYFESFPSGHAGSAATLISLVYLTKIIPALKNKENWFIAASIIFSILVFIGRMVYGAHYFTDVTFSTMLTWTVFIVAAKILKPMEEKKN